MNEVSITINGVRYEAVESPSDPIQYPPCSECDLSEECDISDFTTFCVRHVSENGYFKRVN